MPKTRVAVIKTSPDTVIDDFGRLMRLASYTDSVSAGYETALNIDLSWHHFFPASSATPWQLNGVLNTLIKDGYSCERLYACYGKTSGLSVHKGEVLNRHVSVIERYGIRNIHLDEGEKWVRYEPETPLRILSNVYPDGIYIPERFIDSSIIHLTTLKTDALAAVSGAVHTSFKTLLDEKSNRSYPVYHEALVDALIIAKDVFQGIFAVMDGVFAGEGPGPLSYMPHEKNIILASSDMVALDAVAATLMGFDPLSIPFIRLAHETGLGRGDMNEIEVLGEDISGINFHFSVEQTGMDYRVRRMGKAFASSFLAPFSRLISTLYNDFYWYVHVGEKRIRNAMKGEWGKLFEGYRK